MTFGEFVEEHLHSSTHLAKRHVHPKLLHMYEIAGMNAVFTRADGAYLWTEDGHRFLDLLSGGGVHFIGRNHPRVRAALHDVVDMDLPNFDHRQRIGARRPAGRAVDLARGPAISEGGVRQLWR